jgi:peptidase C39-like protein
MHEILNTLLVTGLAVGAAWVGTRLARLPGRAWMWGWVVPLGILYAAAMGLNFPQFSFTPPLSWITGGWGRWIVVACTASMTLGTLISRLPKSRSHGVLWMLCGVVILRTAAAPFLSPLFTQGTLRSLITQVDGHGVCLQGTFYNCGPAAAVTALRRLGFAAEEGELALLCGTTCLIGTPDDFIADGLREKYGPQGLVVERRYVASIDELRGWPVSIAAIKYNSFVDHYVTVLGFKGDQIVLGDPLCGEDTRPVEDFVKDWRHVAILLRRDR